MYIKRVNNYALKQLAFYYAQIYDGLFPFSSVLY